MELKEALSHRRTCYALGSASPVSDEQIKALLQLAVRHVPSAFNSQTTRLVLLLGGRHARLWQIVKETLRTLLSAEAFAATERKVDGAFAAGHGTVLFYEDQDGVADLQRLFPTYKDSFPTYSEHTSAMHQLAVWMLLDEAGLGASLQHYNPLIDEAVAREFGLPASWRLVAQMPFGLPLEGPGEKSFTPIDDRFLVLDGAE